MKEFILFYSLVFGSTIAMATAPTREWLYEGTTIPSKREFKLSSKISPCDDFHKYVCGETEDSFQLPTNRNGYTFAVNDNSERLIHAKNRYFQLLNKDYQPSSKRELQIKSFFAACMDEASSIKDERNFVAEQKSKIAEITSKEALKIFLASRSNSPLDVFLYGEPDADQEDPTQFDYFISSKLMTLPDRSYYEDKKVLLDFEKMVAAFFKSVGEGVPEAQAKIIVDIERRFAKGYPDMAEIRQRGAKNTYWPREKWLSSYPNLPLNKIFKSLPENVRIRNKIPEAMAFANNLIAFTPIEDIKSYLLFATLRDRLDDGYQDYFKAKFKFEHKHFGGASERYLRGERCTRLVTSHFPFEVDAELTPSLFKGFPKEEVRKITEKVRRALIEQLKENRWLSKSAKTQAIKKMETAQISVATPDREEDWDFRPLRTYSETQPIQNQLILERAMIEQKFERMEKPKNRDLWYLSPLVFNAFYVPEDNRLSILQAMLQPPYFDADYSEIENIAAIGSMAGHELGHGIDDKGSRYDDTGRLKQWMTEMDMQEFKQRTFLFEKRFNEIGHDGSLTLGENVGDHMGLRAAFRAAFSSPSSANRRDLQKFFVAYAKTYCEVNRPDLEKMLLKTDTHALGRARINEQVVHLEEFSRAFSCKPGDRMHRDAQQRFVVW